MKLIVLNDISVKPVEDNQVIFITLADLKNWVLHGTIIKQLFRYEEVELLTYNINYIPKPSAVGLLIRVLSRRLSSIKDISGRSYPITIGSLAQTFANFFSDWLSKSVPISKVKRELEALFRDIQPQRKIMCDLTAPPVYLRTDLWFGVLSGGSVGHIAGVLNNLGKVTGKPIFITSDSIPTVREDIETYAIEPEQRFWDFLELPGLFYNARFYQKALKILNNKKPSFIYQRYSLNNYTGLKLAQHYGIPFVLEYNGSEIWVSRHWGKRLKYEALSERIELLNLMAAQLIIVISQPLKDALVTRGVVHDKILVNPNGVNSDKYSPEVDGSRIRSQNDLNGKTVIGFIGTFGRWHGAEVLAEAFGRLLKEHPTYRASVRLLMIGDGVTMSLVKEALAKHAVGDACILTGRIPQEDGPAHLAACDILASPHVPNSDGTPFFGSPTKLFEYMAMGKGIVASDLDQIGEILKHEQTAWMVKPGDADSLMHGLKMLIDHPELRQRMGKTAREVIVSKYTWQKHTQRIVERLKYLLNERN